MARHPLIAAWLSARMAIRSARRVGRPCIGCEVRTSKGVGTITNGGYYKAGEKLWKVDGELVPEDAFDVVMSPGNLWHTATSLYAWWDLCWKDIDVWSVARGDGIRSREIVPGAWGLK